MSNRLRPRRCPAAAAFALTTVLTGAAGAQDIKPRILLIFDTSGSMGFDLATGEDTLGDNSREYPGNGGISRLSVAKAVITGMLETTSEAEFALMRYPQRQGEDINDGFERGAFTAYAGLAQNPLNYMGFCAGEVSRGADPDTAFSLIVPFAPDNELSILSWLDGHETYPQDPELRAEGPTPIAESLRLAERYYRDVLAADANLRCRQDYVVLLTDGDESCLPQGVDVQAELLQRAIALREMDIVPAGGGPAVRKEVRTYVVGFAVTNRVLNQLNTLARAGGTAKGPGGQVDLINGEAYGASDQAGLRQAFSRILADAIPVEACNGEDDDCDGRVDEGVLNSCGRCGGAPVEVCNDADDDCDGRVDEGVRNGCGACGPVPVEICNGRDDDCDGAIDENVVNACGGCAAVQEELCNGVDDDCDGRVDNTPAGDAPLTRPCGRDQGECRAGEEVCRQGAWVDCTGVGPAEEVCDGRDNDCNGQVDELSRPCGEAVGIGDVGQCRIGRQACIFADCLVDPNICDPDGWGFACEGAVGPADEICDGLDNNCDGAADEGLINACGRCGEALTEACNSEDDNCDGRIDENAVCPPGYLCFVGECVAPCDASMECGGEYTCVQVYPGAGFCHPNGCAGNDCPVGLVCNPDTRLCDDPCRGVSCADGEGCDLGRCVPAACRHVGCAEGLRCGADDACEPDPCAGVACGDRQFCREGVCVDACVGRFCGAGLTCVDGTCIDDPCGGRCLRSEVCDPTDGACAESPCARVTCAEGLACIDGECRADAPCATLECPLGTRCVDGTCTDGTPGVAPDLSGGGIVPPEADAGPSDDGGPGSDAQVESRDAFFRPPVGDARPAEAGAPNDSAANTGGEPAAAGCGCRTHATAHGSAAWAWLLGLGLLGVRRRRGVR
jgi:MYXO-CTERM domain-containing protein